MKAHTASLINAILLIVLPLWGYLSSETPSITALIPAFIGVILLAMNYGVKKENKIIAHIAVLLTLVILFGLIKPLKGAIGRSDTLAIGRVLVMIISTVVAMIFFVKSFIDAKKRRAQDELIICPKVSVNGMSMCTHPHPYITPHLPNRVKRLL